MIQDQDEINYIIQDLKDDFHAYIVPPHSSAVSNCGRGSDEYSRDQYSFSITIPCERLNRNVYWEELYPYIEELDSRLDELGYFIWNHRIYYTVSYNLQAPSKYRQIASPTSANFGEMVNSSFVDDSKLSDMKDHYDIKSAILFFAKKEEHTKTKKFIRGFKNFTKALKYNLTKNY